MKFKDQYFGNEYRVAYDVIQDHDAYAFLRISLEVDRKLPDTCTVLLNGKEIGAVMFTKNRYYAFRKSPMGDIKVLISTDPDAHIIPCTSLDRPFDALGHAVAAIITDYV